MADDLVKKLRSQIGDDVQEIYSHEALFRLAADRIEQLEREKREAALDALAAMGQAQEAYEAQLKAEATVATLTAQVEALRGAVLNLPAVYAHQINTGVREVYDPLQRFFTLESVLAAITTENQNG